MKEKELLEGSEVESLSPVGVATHEASADGVVVSTSGNGGERGPVKRSTGAALLKHAGAWLGNDLKQRLKEVYENRGEAPF